MFDHGFVAAAVAVAAACVAAASVLLIYPHMHKHGCLYVIRSLDNDMFIYSSSFAGAQMTSYCIQQSCGCWGTLALTGFTV